MKELFVRERNKDAKVAVLVSLYNYAAFVCETLDTVAAQTLENIELVVCNDCSTDDSAAVVMDWMRRHEDRFSRLALIENDVNSGLSATRNVSTVYAAAPYLFILDADNKIYPRCLERSLEILEESAPEAAFVYTLREMFCGQEPHGFALENLEDWNVSLLLQTNNIDAMVLHKRSALERVGGYATDDCLGRLGLEDYELWLKYIQAGFHGIKIHQPLIRYRLHSSSMIHTITCKQENRKRLWERLHELHPELFPPELRDHHLASCADPEHTQSTFAKIRRKGKDFLKQHGLFGTLRHLVTRVRQFGLRGVVRRISNG